MILSVIALSWSLANCCPLVQQLRAQGHTDEQIETMARSHGVPERIISWAKRRCTKP